MNTNFSTHHGAKPVLLCAHRGQSATRPENTMVAFEEARRLNAASIELDTVLTKDKEIVVMHDLSVNRTTNATGSVSDFTLGEIKKLSASNKFKNFDGERIPTLKDVVNWSKQNNMLLEIEVKEENDMESYLGSLYALLKDCDNLDNLMVIGFDHVFLKEIKKKISVRTEAIIHCRPADAVSVVTACHADAVSIEYNMFNADDAKRLKKAGIIIRLSIPEEKKFAFYENNDLQLGKWIGDGLIDLISNDDMLYLKKLLNVA